jgi:hypothetical protein
MAEWLAEQQRILDAEREQRLIKIAQKRTGKWWQYELQVSND